METLEFPADCAALKEWNKVVICLVYFVHNRLGFKYIVVEFLIPMSPMEFARGKIFSDNVVFILLVAALAVALFFNVFHLAEPAPDPNSYQAVLLANDQAFYGKLHAVHSDYPYLTDVYYLKQQAASVDKNGRPIQGPDKFTVIKRGVDEIHAPADPLYIAHDKIIYWENVGVNSPLANGIKVDKEVRSKQLKK